MDFFRKKYNSNFFSAYSKAGWASCLQIYIKIYADKLLHPNVTNKCISIWLQIVICVFLEFVNVWNKMLKQGPVLKSFSFVFDISKLLFCNAVSFAETTI